VIFIGGYQMSKNQFSHTLNWQATDPRTAFLPVNYNQNSGGSAPSGTLTGAMASTNVVYSNILEISRIDNIGVEAGWTGTPTGVLAILVSNSGVNWAAPVISSALSQPAGSASNIYRELTNCGAKFIMATYTNTSGTGVLSVTLQLKNLS